MSDNKTQYGYGGMNLGLMTTKGQGMMIDCAIDNYGDIVYETNWPGQKSTRTVTQTNGPISASHLLILTPRASESTISYISIRGTKFDQYFTFYGCDISTY